MTGHDTRIYTPPYGVTRDINIKIFRTVLLLISSWGSESSGIQRCVAGLVFLDGTKNGSTFIFEAFVDEATLDPHNFESY